MAVLNNRCSRQWADGGRLERDGRADKRRKDLAHNAPAQLVLWLNRVAPLPFCGLECPEVHVRGVECVGRLFERSRRGW